MSKFVAGEKATNNAPYSTIKGKPVKLLQLMPNGYWKCLYRTTEILIAEENLKKIKPLKK